MMKIVICDNDIEELQIVSDFCNSVVCAVVETYSSPQQFVDEVLASKDNVDLFILDIEMPGISGIELKDRIIDMGFRTDIAFLTSHDEMMESAFGRNVIAFLKKEDWRERLEGILLRIQKAHKNCICVEKGKEKIFLHNHQIISVNGEDYYSRIKFISNNIKEESVLVRKSLKLWEVELDSDEFLRISKSAIICFYNVSRIDSKSIKMCNGDYYLIGKGKKKKVLHEYFEYLKRNERNL